MCLSKMFLTMSLCTSSCVRLSTFLSISASMSLCVPYVHLCVMPLSMSMSVCLSLFCTSLSLFLSLFLSLSLSWCLYRGADTCVFVCNQSFSLSRRVHLLCTTKWVVSRGRVSV